MSQWYCMQLLFLFHGVLIFRLFFPLISAMAIVHYHSNHNLISVCRIENSCNTNKPLGHGLELNTALYFPWCYGNLSSSCLLYCFELVLAAMFQLVYIALRVEGSKQSSILYFHEAQISYKLLRNWVNTVVGKIIIRIL